MTLDEAIRHAAEVAEEHEKIKCIKAVTLEECKCASEHRKLAEWLKDYKRLKEQEPCADAISRQAVLEQIDQWAIGNREYLPTNAMHCLTKRIQDIPPVNPQPKTGHWKAKSFHELFCDNCGFDFDIMRNDFIDKMNYCPNCGAKMVEPQESEE